MANETIRANISIGFTVRTDYRNQRVLDMHFNNISVPDASPPYDLHSLTCILNDLQELTYDDTNVVGINWQELDEEKMYEAEAYAEIHYTTIYGYFEGPEQDLNVLIGITDIKSVKEFTHLVVDDSKPDFHFTTNNDGDFLKIRWISEERIFVHVAHSCVSRKMFIHPRSLTKLLLEYEGK